MGGFQWGTQGEILSLMSGGFDSTVASYLTIKRGEKTHYLFLEILVELLSWNWVKQVYLVFVE